MSSPSRRTLLWWIGTLTPGAVTVASSTTGGRLLLPNSEKDPVEQPEAILGIGAWLHDLGVTGAVQVGQEDLAISDDMRLSFANDPLIEVDGFLLPAGFCNYCVAMYRRNAALTRGKSDA